MAISYRACAHHTQRRPDAAPTALRGRNGRHKHVQPQHPREAKHCRGPQARAYPKWRGPQGSATSRLCMRRRQPQLTSMLRSADASSSRSFALVSLGRPGTATGSRAPRRGVTSVSGRSEVAIGACKSMYGMLDSPPCA